MNRLLGTLWRICGGDGEDRPPDLDATLRRLRADTPVPVFWLLGKTQSGKTSVVRFLTGAPDAVVGSGFRPTTRTTRRFEFPTPEAPLLTFLDTRGLDEPGYDPTDDIARLDPLAHVVIVTVKATDLAQGTVRAVLEPVRRASPSRPVVLCVTCLHEAIPRKPLPEPYPAEWLDLPVATPDTTAGMAAVTDTIAGMAASEVAVPGVAVRAAGPTAVPDDLRRCLAAHTRAFAGLVDAVVPIDLTRPEDGFPDPNYGGEQLKATLLRFLPAAYRQTLLRLSEATETLKDVHRRHAEPIILGYATLAATAGAVPVPLVDLFIIPGIQVRMARHLAGVYGQPFSPERFREVAAALGVGLLARHLARQATKLLPFLGSAVGAAVAGATTYALGRALCYYYQAVCEGHVPDAAALKVYYQQQYAEAERRFRVGNR